MMAPSNPELTIKVRWSGPISCLTKCGTTIPMKPIPPDTATAIPVAAATAKIALFFKFCVATPM